MREARLSAIGRVTVLMGSIALLGGCGGAGGAGPAEPAPAAPAERPTPTAVTRPEEPAAPVPDLDTVRAGRFDQGKMWTFEYPPLDYFRAAYGFEPDSSWFRRARLGALRLPNCSASFVSPNGLVLTNHHCARESVTQVSRPGESLLDSGFYARALDGERAVDDLVADQLIALVDVTDEVHAALEGLRGTEREQAEEEIGEEISQRLELEHGGEEAGIVVEIISLWDGARYSAYVFKRYTDLRLVMAPELQIGYFGGDPDNFTYPRYNLDMSFFRVYDDQGVPLKPENYFRWSEDGVEEGDAVFIIGNPGSTSRLQTVAQLEFRRDVGDKATLDFITSRLEVLREFMNEHPNEAEEMDLRNEIFSLENSQKAYRGIWEGLQDPILMARRRDAERQFRAAIQADSALRARYSGIIDSLARIQEEKSELAAEYGAFLALGNPTFTSTTLMRGFFSYQYLVLEGRGAAEAVLTSIESQILGVNDQHIDLQRGLLSARLSDLREYFGSDSRIVQDVLEGRSPRAAAAEIIAGSVLSDSTATARALAEGTLSMEDPGVRVISAVVDRLREFQVAFQSLMEREADLVDQLGRARFDVYGTTIPPDATFSLRIADGLVEGYQYNGTYAPVYTTFYGLYDHYYSYGADSPWDLPERWVNYPQAFELSKPLNFISTADIIGGNSGSPVLNTDLEVVGVVFDGNIESLPGDFIYVPTRNRAVAVDVRGMLEALDEMYDADRLVLELLTGRLVPTEQEADRVTAGSRRD